MMFDVIVACETNGGIGCGGMIPWYIKEDMRRFKELTCTVPKDCVCTKQNVVIMGRKTWESLPMKPLYGRLNIVISSTMKEPYDKSYRVVSSFQEALDHVASLTYVHRTFVIGGSDVYKHALEHTACDNIYLTQVVYSAHLPENNCAIKYDAFFPLERLNELYYAVYDDWCSSGPILYRFSTWYKNF